MAGNSYRDESLSFTHSSSSPIQVSEADAFLTDHNSHIGSASGSFQNDGILANGESGSGSNSEAEFGFGRPEFRQFPLVGTVQIYERHVFLCYKNPQVWPPHIEAAEFDRLPRLLSAALMARKGEMKKKTRLTICEGHDGTETSNGDVLIFPDMIRYRRLTHFDVDTFVEEVLVKDTEWLPGTPEMLYGSFIFICCHGSRDRRCGVCGPALVARFREEVDVRKLQHQVSISPCSHIGGHKYAGNVIIFGRKSNCHEVTGHWYGYVCPEDVPILIEQHIVKGEVVDRLWRGQMGLSEEDQIKAHEFRLQLSREARRENNGNTGRSIENVQCYLSGCCLESKTSSCYQNQGQKDKNESTQTRRADGKKIEKAKKESKNPFNKNVSTRRTCPLPTWFETWEREDTYTALALLGAAVSVSIAYSFSKQLS